MQKSEELFCTILQQSTALPEQQQPQPNTATCPVSTGSASISPRALPQGPARPSVPGSPGITPCDNSPSTADQNNNNARGTSDDEQTVAVEVCSSIYIHTSISHRITANFCAREEKCGRGVQCKQALAHTTLAHSADTLYSSYQRL